jgi:hypothetical protein
MDQENIRNLKLSVLDKLYPAECDLVGQEDLEVVISGPVEIEQKTFGSKLDFFTAYTVVVGAVSVIDCCVSLYLHWPELKGEARIKRLTEEINRVTMKVTISEKDKLRILEKVEEHIKRYE